jgi:hypothetical protein
MATTGPVLEMVIIMKSELEIWEFGIGDCRVEAFRVIVSVK